MSLLTPEQWDRHAIKAAIHRKGITLENLSLDNGLSRDDCAVALCKPYPRADLVISRFLGVPLNELWPDRYDENNKRIYSQRKSNRKPVSKASQKSPSSTDMGKVQ